MDNSGLVVGVLMATVVLRVVLVTAAAWWLIPSRVACPHCAAETATIVAPRVISLVGLQIRWCLACGWSGLAKRRRRARRLRTTALSSMRSLS